MDLLVHECFWTPSRVCPGPNVAKFDIKTLICQLYFVVFGLLYTKKKMENGPIKNPTTKIVKTSFSMKINESDT